MPPEDQVEFSTDALPAQNAGDGMPVGNLLTPHIEASQVIVTPGGATPPAFDDNAAATIVWENFQEANAWLDEQQWMMEWQVIDWFYQSPTMDRGWSEGDSRPARISRFNIAENKHTLATQVRRGIFADEVFFLLEPQGKLAGDPNAQKYIDAWTELLTQLCKKADLEYQMELFIDCMCLQGTAIAVPGWEEKEVIRRTRKSQTKPTDITLPDGTTKSINTWESDDYKVVDDVVVESWPYFEFRRLGMTMYSPKWRTPGRPDLTGERRTDVNYVNMEDLQWMRKLECYKDISSDEDLVTFFLQHQQGGDAENVATVAGDMNSDSTFVPHAAGEYRHASHNPFDRPFLLISEWTGKDVKEILVYQGRRKTIRNSEHFLEDHALGYSATWYNIPNSGYGFGVGRVNLGDQRMAQGILNEVLKMIAYPMSAPLMYNTANGNEPTQSLMMGLGTMWGVNSPSGDVRKEFSYLQAPEVPALALPLYQLATQGGKDSVGASGQTMGGQPSSTQGIGRTSFGAQRLATQADAGVSTPIAHIEQVLERFLRFLCLMVRERMPIKEIRDILSNKFSAAILESIDVEFFLQDSLFSLKILAGQKLAARAAIAQLIPFLLQIVQQPQMLQYLHEKGQTVNFKAIEDMFIQMSELQGRQDIFVEMTPEEKANVAQFNPEATRVKLAQALEQLKQQGTLANTKAKGDVELRNTIVTEAVQALHEKKPEPSQLDLAENRDTRNTDLNYLDQGLPTA